MSPSATGPRRPEPARQLEVPGVLGRLTGSASRPATRSGSTSTRRPPTSLTWSGWAAARSSISRRTMPPTGRKARWSRPSATIGRHARGCRRSRTCTSVATRSREGPVTLGTWLRLWRLPVIDAVQWAWFGLITDVDYPDKSRFGILVDHAGRIATYAGDGGLFDHHDLHVSHEVLGEPAGRVGPCRRRDRTRGRHRMARRNRPAARRGSDSHQRSRSRIPAPVGGKCGAGERPRLPRRRHQRPVRRGGGAGRCGDRSDRGRRRAHAAARAGHPRPAWRLGAERGAWRPDRGLERQRTSRHAGPGRHLADRLGPRSTRRGRCRATTRPRTRTEATGCATVQRRRGGLQMVGDRRVARPRRRGFLRPVRGTGAPGGPGHTQPANHVRGRPLAATP